MTNGMKFLVHKSSGDTEVLLLPFKGTNQYSFVNLTRGHICPCVFDSFEDALRDMENRKSRGLLDGYEVVEEDDNAPLTLDELREMDGEPVYITRGGKWVICYGTSDFTGRLCMEIDMGGQIPLCDYGKTWLAYRRKPEARHDD